MGSDKITVDEPLISTDVDKLIRTVAEKKKVSLDELQNLCRIDRKTLDKWIAVLEDTGYVVVKYTLGNTFIIWSGTNTVPAHPVEVKKVEEPIAPIKEPHAQKQTPDPELLVATEVHTPDPELLKVEENKKEIDVEPMVEVYTKKVNDETALDSLKYGILTKLNEDEKPIEAEPVSKEETIEPVEMKKEEEIKPVEVPKPVQEIKVEETTSTFSNDTKTSLNEYVEAIKQEKAFLSQLESEKERVYSDRISSLEGKVDSSITMFTQKVLEKEQKLLELKESFLELPDKVEEVEKLQAQLDHMRDEGVESLQNARKKTEQLLGAINDSRADVRGRIEKLETLIQDEDSKVGQLERLNLSLEAKVEKLTSAITDAKTQMNDLNSVMETLANELDVTNGMRSKIESMSSELKDGVGVQSAELKTLEQELEGISRVELLVNKYLDQYEKKLDEIEAYVSKSDDEVAELKKIAESTYLKRYLSELENSAQEYEAELEGAINEDQEIETKITESKAKIASMISQSRQLVRKLQGEMTPSNFENARSAAKARVTRMREMIKEKAAERSNILKESQGVRKTQELVTTEETPAPSKTKKKKKKE